MAISIDVVLDLAVAERELSDFQDQFVTQVREAAKTGEAGFAALAEKTDQELRKLAASALKEQEKIAAAAQKTFEQNLKGLDSFAAAIEEVARRTAEAQEEGIDNFAQAIAAAAEEAQAAHEQLAEDAERAQEDLAKGIKEQQNKWSQGAESFRGFVGDVGDAIGSLGKGLFGWSEQTQLVADKTAYMTEKGMALGHAIGGLFGPLGAVAGSAIGFVGGGLFGLFAGNAENATNELVELNAASFETARTQRELSRAIAELNKQLGAVSTKGLTGAVARLDIAEKEEESLKNQRDDIQAVIWELENKKIIQGELSDQENAALEENRKKFGKIQDQYINTMAIRQKLQGELKAANEEDAKESELLAKKKETWTKKDFQLAKKLAKEKLDATENELKSQQDIIKTRTNTEVITKAAKEVERLKVVVEKERAAYEKAGTELENYGNKGKAAYKKTAAEGVKALEVIRDHAESMMDDGRDGVGYITEDTGEAYLDMLGFMVKLSNDEVANIRAHNKEKEEAEMEFQHNMQMLKQEGFLRTIRQQEQQRAKEAQEIEQYANTVNSAIRGVGQVFSSEIGGVATDAFNSWLETIATGEKDAEKSFKKTAAALVRSIGEQLVADGIKNIFMGTGNLLTGQPAGGALIALGGGEIAAGIGMGAAGARAQRRQGYGKDEESKTSSTSSLGRNANNSGVQVQAPSVINLGMLALTDQRQMEMAGKQIAQAQYAYQQGRR